MKIFIKKSEGMNANNVLNNFKYHKIVVLLYLTITGIPIISGSVINYGLFGLISISIFVLLITNKGLKIRNNNYLKWIIPVVDRKSTRLNSSHVSISYAVFCLKKKKKKTSKNTIYTCT